MLIFEVTATETNAARIAALATYHMGRDRDTGNDKPMPVAAFIKMAQNLGISLTDQQLRDMASKPPLSELIKNITDDEIVFRDGDNDTKDQMSVDQAQKTVDKMSKRAAKKGV